MMLNTDKLIAALGDAIEARKQGLESGVTEENVRRYNAYRDEVERELRAFIAAVQEG